jgi:hypothetical protein
MHADRCCGNNLHNQIQRRNAVRDERNSNIDFGESLDIDASPILHNVDREYSIHAIDER